MGNLSLRDRAILMSVVVLALYGLAAVLWFTKFQREWTKSAKGYAESVKTYQREKNLIARRGSLEESYLEEEEKIPVVFRCDLSAGKIADTIAEASGAKVLTLWSGHTVSRDA